MKKTKTKREREVDVLREIVCELAECEWQGKGEEIQDLIFRARIMAGWSEREIKKDRGY